jgi:beta-lactamase superfamily II metal-dependent hydrolase
VRFVVFNVGHGFCALLVADNGNVALFDCGHDDENGFRPSVTLPAMGVTAIQHFYLSHYDKDHVSDLPALRATLPINTLHTNTGVTTDQIRAIKWRVGPIDLEVESALAMTDRYSQPATVLTAYPNALQGVDIRTFQLPYGVVGDTNNLSMVTFIHHPLVSIVIPGDLEQLGWRILLLDHDFVANLGRVNVFVASHHGRANGYLPEIFTNCHPDIVVISDTTMQFDTQEHNYRIHANGIPWNNRREMRKVITTRSDGIVVIDTNTNTGYRYYVSTHR